MEAISAMFVMVYMKVKFPSKFMKYDMGLSVLDMTSIEMLNKSKTIDILNEYHFLLSRVEDHNIRSTICHIFDRRGTGSLVSCGALTTTILFWTTHRFLSIRVLSCELHVAHVAIF